jgi:hypothetical protein
MPDEPDGKLVASIPSTHHWLSSRIEKLTDGNDATNIVGCPTLEAVHLNGQQEALAVQHWPSPCLIVFRGYAIGTFFPNRSPTDLPVFLYPASTLLSFTTIQRAATARVSRALCP